MARKIGKIGKLNRLYPHEFNVNDVICKIGSLDKMVVVKLRLGNYGVISLDNDVFRRVLGSGVRIFNCKFVDRNYVKVGRLGASRRLNKR